MKQFRYSTSTLLNFRSKFLFLVAVILLTACDYSDVELRDIREIKIEKLDKNGIEIRGSAKVYNPNNYKIKVQSTDADLFLDGRQAGEAKLLDKVVIPANFDDFIDFRIRTDFTAGSVQLIPIIIGASVKRSVNIEIKGTAKAKTFIIGKKFDFDYEHKATF
ncbi:hypothetical protein G3O08_10700 [Cryomorpha ignava]|uniref:Late embryogenesis abundant protein LEA-2 subgroup domain-containing protein n=1 Tax=Cryomorpha ignava TaxID=101383 RepID=A0A7K3WR10_9FLAO|nr:LEA type 2 family protein [Cryomorpha ignava]NEN23968.1 hypothetical protein [Cryomorpha ignava]